MEKGFSQNYEQHHIIEYFKDRIGKYIDIGAFDAFRFSNTRALFELGWSGVLVEPIEKLCNGIKEVYKDEPRIEVLRLAIGLSNEPLNLGACEDAVSTSDPAWRKAWEDAGVKYWDEVVPQMHVAEFMEKYCTPDVLFISQDTEQTNMELFRATPDFIFGQIQLYCIEHDEARQKGNIMEIEKRLSEFGFYRKYFNHENIILGK